MKQSKSFRILCFFGTRPEAIKMAPVVGALKDSPHFKVTVVVSAQHRNMLDQVLKIFRIHPDYDLNVMQEGQSLTEVTARVLKRIEPVLVESKPDLMLVHGDTSTTLGGALGAFYGKIPIGHVEAGLRTGDMSRPYPEEMNRRLTDGLSTLFFAPTKGAKGQLIRENHDPNHIFVTGNTVIDALHSLSRTIKKPKTLAVQRLARQIDERRERFILMTAHRRENFGDPFRRIFKSVAALSRRYPRVHWIYPVHPNPNVVQAARLLLKGLENVHLIAPLDYYDFLYLLKNCYLVMTDSGGLQEEGPALGKPVLVFREVTERPEAVHVGIVKLVGSNGGRIEKETERLITDKSYYGAMARVANPYGDGRASSRIRDALLWYFGISRKKPVDFQG